MRQAERSFDPEAEDEPDPSSMMTRASCPEQPDEFKVCANLLCCDRCDCQFCQGPSVSFSYVGIGYGNKVTWLFRPGSLKVHRGRGGSRGKKPIFFMLCCCTHGRGFCFPKPKFAAPSCLVLARHLVLKFQNLCLVLCGSNRSNPVQSSRNCHSRYTVCSTAVGNVDRSELRCKIPKYRPLPVTATRLKPSKTSGTDSAAMRTFHAQAKSHSLHRWTACRHRAPLSRHLVAQPALLRLT